MLPEHLLEGGSGTETGIEGDTDQGFMPFQRYTSKYLIHPVAINKVVKVTSP
nr:hypothetical protein [Mucilaginibacter humi]